MKNINLKLLALLFILTMTLPSCLNDLEDYMGDFSGSPATAEILNRPSAATGLTLIGFVDPTKKIDITIKVSISRSTPMDVPTKVTMGLDNTLIDAYNTKKHYTGLDAGIPVPDAALLFTSMDVTIPANKYDAEFKFQVDPSKIVNAAALNIIPLEIASAENGVQVSGNFGTALIQILGRNKWDGVYTVTGNFVDYVNAAWGPYYPKTIHLVTTGAWTCDRYDAEDESTYYVFDAGGSLSAFGSFYPYFKFDGSDNIIDVINTAAPTPPRNRKAVLFTGTLPGAWGAPAVMNKYNPTTKTLDVAFQMSQDDVTPNLRCLIWEHYVYVGPRPE